MPEEQIREVVSVELAQRATTLAQLMNQLDWILESNSLVHVQLFVAKSVNLQGHLRYVKPIDLQIYECRRQDQMVFHFREDLVFIPELLGCFLRRSSEPQIYLPAILNC